MEPSKIKVLYVDDEINNLNSFKANFRRFFEVYIADSAEEGRKILKNNEIHVLITDQRMPIQNGVQFLESIIKLNPLTIRIILTGYTDLETVVEAINKGQIYKYIIKPFDMDELISTIESAYDLYMFRKTGESALTKFRQLFESNNEAIFIMGTDWHLQELNNYGLNLFNIQRNELSNVVLGSLFNSPDEFNEVKKQLIKRKSIVDFPAKLKNSNHRSIDALISAIPIKEEDVVIGYQCMIRDITKQKEMENLVIRAIIETQENERIQFSKNLHDSIGQKLAAVRLFLQEIPHITNKTKQENEFNKLHTIVNNTIIELRNICFNIRPKTLEALGIEGAINELVTQNTINGGIIFNTSFSKNVPQLDEQLEITIFRIVQEFIANSLKHSEATIVEMSFSYISGKIHIGLKDNGKGFNPKSNSKHNGMGLKNIRSRIQSYNGNLAIDSKPGHGVEFSISIPYIKKN